MMQGFIVTVTTRIWQLAAINLFAIVLCGLGLGVFGIAPALTAAFWAVARLEDERTGPLIRGMWAQYRAEFLRTNLLAAPHIAAVTGLFWIGLIGGGLIGGLLMALAVMVLVHLLSGLFAISRLSGTLADGFANARLGVALAPYGTLLALAGFVFGVWVTVQQPLIGLYFGLSGFAWLTHLLVAPALSHTMPTPTRFTPIRQEAS